METIAVAGIILILAILAISATTMPTAFTDKVPTMVIYSFIGLVAASITIYVWKGR